MCLYSVRLLFCTLWGTPEGACTGCLAVPAMLLAVAPYFDIMCLQSCCCFHIEAALQCEAHYENFQLMAQ